MLAQVQALQSQRRVDPADHVEQFFNAPIPEALWHYTTLSGLEGILRSGRIWATEARHTTDQSEFVHAHDLAVSYLKNLEPKTDSEKRAKQDGLHIVEGEFGTGALSEKATEVFVASFSSVENLKSQWTEYSDKGKGVSIAFDLRKIRPPKSLQVAVTLAPCIYKQQEAEKLLRVAFGHYFRSVVELIENTASLQWVKQRFDGWKLVGRIYGQAFDRKAFDAAMEEDFSRSLRSNIALTQWDLLRLASHCKHPYFSEEQEWRLALPHTKATPLTHVKIEYRGPRHNIPYIAHDLFQTGRLPITQVMAGPFCEAAAVEHVLREHGYAVPVSKSSSPARSPDQV
jgi:hypothetical protein